MTDPRADPDYTATAGGVAVAPLASAPDAVRSETTIPAQATALTHRRTRSVGATVLAIVGFIIVSLVTLAVLAYLIAGLGAIGVAIAGVMALVPLAIVFLGMRWVDRWEPEPRSALLFAFLWGAGASVLIALLVDAQVQGVVAAAGGPSGAAEFFGAAVQAPIVEELAKGIGVLILFWSVRRHFDGPVDGIVYAAWVGGGFAFTENILYFGVQLTEGGLFTAGTVETFVIRGFMSPFAHVMFTALIGAAVGLAAQRGSRFALGAFVLGLVPAVLLHAFWNGALFFVGDFYGYYLLVQVPLFLLAIAIVVLLRRQEVQLTQARLAEYAQAGWLHPEEVGMLATPSGRRAATAWAARAGAAGLMAAFIRDATRLAYARQRLLGGRDHIGTRLDEAQLLERVSAARHALRANAPRD